ncbi:MAG TPA: Yip1 family protein [Rubrobacteraceae bacterium]|nr:Yip1 family protein [Rubrobacteraceae bacterium]
MPGGGPSGFHSSEGFGNVVLGVWLAPRKFFGRLDPEGAPLRPALFAAAVLYLNLLFEELLQDAWRLEFNYGLLYAALPGLVVSLILAPLLVAGLSTLVLTVLDGGPSRRKFGLVFRALGYATAIGIVLWIPYAPLFALPYGFYIATVAVKEALSLSWKRATTAALVPLGAVLLIILLLTAPEEAFRLLINPPGE